MNVRALLGPNPTASAAPAQWSLPFTIDEPDVSLTDFGLALESAIFATILARQVTPWTGLRRWGANLFGAVAVASVAGAIDHGFLRRGGRESGHDIAWTVSLLAIGASTLALVGIGAEIGLSRPAARRLVAAATWLLIVYTLVVLVAWRDFRVAILAYAPAAAFLLVVFALRAARLRDRDSVLGSASVALAFVAAAVQQMEISVEAVNLSHNAVYHLIQASSLALLFIALRRLLRHREDAIEHKPGGAPWTQA